MYKQVNELIVRFNLDRHHEGRVFFSTHYLPALLVDGILTATIQG
jgi:hypothetical protein